LRNLHHFVDKLNSNISRRINILGYDSKSIEKEIKVVLAELTVEAIHVIDLII